MSEQIEAVDAAPEAAKIQRYQVHYDDDAGSIEHVESDTGPFVYYEDHLMAMLNPLNTALCKDMPAVYRMLQFLLDNIADLEQEPSFAGFQIQRATNDQGELQFIRLIPCDKIGDITVARTNDVKENQVIKAAVRDTLVLVKP